MTKPAQFSARIRFNWGFHDGAAEAQSGKVRDMARHFDSAYADGYRRGVETFRAYSVRPVTSEPAWLAREKERAALKAMRERMPEREVRV